MSSFLDTFCICSKKVEENGVCALIHPILLTFDTACAEY